MRRKLSQNVRVILFTSLFWWFLGAFIYLNTNQPPSGVDYPTKLSHSDESKVEPSNNHEAPQNRQEIQLEKPQVDVQILGMFGEKFSRDADRPSGPGEGGIAVELTKEEEQEAERHESENQFNLVKCEKTHTNRSLPDYRHDNCLTRPYNVDLPDVSIVIVFHEEAWCTLIRSVHSIINRTPRRYLKEIILVDDASTRSHLKEDLDNFAANRAVPIHVVRLPSRSGLIQARLAGAAVATAKVLIFLDSHIEATTGWVEPLLHEINVDRTRVPVPTIDNIKFTTFEYLANRGQVEVGGFQWSLTYSWFPMTASERKRINGDDSLPVKTPAMAGGLFAIERDYFYEVGSYDDQMEIWGGENIEMSLRIWQCGGSIWIVPCSHVGHVFRDKSPYSWPGGVSNILSKNNRRLAEVWMDDFKKFWFFVSPGSADAAYGDVSERKAFRERNQCKSFAWYIQNVWPESTYNLAVYNLGELKNPISRTCVDTMGRKSQENAGLIGCHGQGGHQAFAFTKQNEIRSDGLCLDASSHDADVQLYNCHHQGGNQYWEFDTINSETGSRTFRHRSTNQCLTANNSNQQLKLATCKGLDEKQVWIMSDAHELADLLDKYKN